jgi:1-deoxy-D-xylulose-5-phosphate reductoisomerase
VKTLDFFEADVDKFSLIKAARLALEEGGSFPVALNSANEVAVSAFLEKRIKFINISEVVMEIVEKHQKREVLSLEEIFDVDRETRLLTQNLLKERY